MEDTIEVLDLQTGELAERLDTAEQGFEQRPKYTLFSSRAVVIATLVGTPVAGTALLAANYRRQGQAGRGWMTLLVGAAISALAVAVAYRMPWAGAGAVGVALLIGMRIVAMGLQAKAIERHLAAGGRLASNWIALAAGIVFAAVIAGVVYFAGFKGQTRTKVVIGTKDEVYYTGKATEAEALALGNALKTAGYFADKGSSVFLDKEPQASGPMATTISMVVQEGAWDDPAILRKEEEVVREVARSVGGLPVHVRVIDSEERVWRQGVVGRSSVNGKDEVLYFGRATADEAAALDHKLSDVEFFTGQGASVLLNKDDDGTTLEFVISDEVADADKVKAFEDVVQDVAPEIGGLPVKLQLVDAGLDVKKEVVVR